MNTFCSRIKSLWEEQLLDPLIHFINVAQLTYMIMGCLLAQMFGIGLFEAEIVETTSVGSRLTDLKQGLYKVVSSRNDTKRASF